MPYNPVASSVNAAVAGHARPTPSGNPKTSLLTPVLSLLLLALFLPSAARAACTPSSSPNYVYPYGATQVSGITLNCPTIPALTNEYLELSYNVPASSYATPTLVLPIAGMVYTLDGVRVNSSTWRFGPVSTPGPATNITMTLRYLYVDSRPAYVVGTSGPINAIVYSSALGLKNQVLLAYVQNPPAPTLSTFSPAQGNVGAQVSMTLNGTNLYSPGTVILRNTTTGVNTTIHSYSGGPTGTAYSLSTFTFTFTVPNLPGYHYVIYRSATGAETSYVGSFTITLPCTSFALSPASPFNANGQSGTMTVTALPSGCNTTWSASSTQTWLTMYGGMPGYPAQGTGNGSFTYSATANTTTATRYTDIVFRTMTGAEIYRTTYAQPPPSTACTSFTLADPGPIPPAGGTGSIAVIGAPTGCTGGSWTATSSQSWFTLTSSSGTGPGSINWSATANTTGQTRSSTLSVSLPGTTPFTRVVTQAPYTCTSFTLSDPGIIPVGGGSGRITVTALPVGCTGPWAVVSSQSWLVLTDATGAGNGSFGYSAGANPGTTSRSSVVSGPNFNVTPRTITQAGLTACTSFTLSDPGPIPPAGGSGRITVTALPAGCTGPWAITSSQSWFVLSSASGSGSGSFAWSAGANNTGQTRSSTLSGANTTSRTVTQLPLACTFTLSDPGTIPAGGGSGRITVTVSPTGCTAPWSISSSQSWFVISGASGSGSGSFAWSAGANNTGQTRTSTLSGANTTSRTVVQPALGDCTYALSYSGGIIPYFGGYVGLSVVQSGEPGCRVTPWQVSLEPAGFLTATGAMTGDGSASVSLTASVNPNPTSRQTTVSLVRQSNGVLLAPALTLTQEGTAVEPCDLIPATPPTLPASGGAASVTISASSPPNCTPSEWTATTASSWLVLTTWNGFGPGRIDYQAGPNPDPPDRAAIVTLRRAVDGATTSFVVIQSGTAPCTLSLSHPGLLPAAAGNTTLALGVEPASCRDLFWLLASSQPWLRIQPGSGNGPLSAPLAWDPNPDPYPRTAYVTLHSPGSDVLPVRLEITQAPLMDPESCTSWTFQGPGGPVPAEGLILSVGVTPGPAGCTGLWTPLLDPPPGWVRLLTSTTSGPGAVRLDVEPNSTGAPRSFRLRAGDAVLVIEQAAEACRLALGNPIPRIMKAAGGGSGRSGRVIVSVEPEGCAMNWSTSTASPWLFLVTPGGSGAGLARFRAAVNPDPEPRSGHITIGGQTVEVWQDALAPGECASYEMQGSGSVPGREVEVGAEGGETGVEVQAYPEGCQSGWEATSNSEWANVGSGEATQAGLHRLASGRLVASSFGGGSGAVRLRADANPGPGPRTAFLMAGGALLRVFQAAPAPGPLTLDTAALPAGEAGRAYDHRIEVHGGTPPYAFSLQNPLLAPLPAGLSLSGATGRIAGLPVGPGQAEAVIQVTDSGLPPQSLTARLPLTIGEPECRFAVSPGALDFGSGLDQAELTVAASSELCVWRTDRRDAGWLVVLSSWQGSRVMRIAAQPNAGGARQAVISVAGREVVIRQAGAGGGAALILSPSSLHLRLRQGERRTVPVAVLSGEAGREIAYQAAVEGGAAWLTLAPPAAQTTPETLLASITAEGLEPGSYEASIRVASPGADPPQRSCAILLEVEPRPPVRLRVERGGFLVVGERGRELPRQSLHLDNDNAGELWYSVEPLAGWIRAGDRGSVHAKIEQGGFVEVPIWLNGEALPAGVSRSALRISSITTGESFELPVTVVLAANLAPRVEVDRAGVRFSPGSAGRASVEVRNAGGGRLGWQASVDGDAPWLVLTDAEGEAPPRAGHRSEIGLSLAPEQVARLSPGSHTARVVVESPEGGVAEVLVTLEVWAQQVTAWVALSQPGEAFTAAAPGRRSRFTLASLDPSRTQAVKLHAPAWAVVRAGEGGDPWPGGEARPLAPGGSLEVTVEIAEANRPAGDAAGALYFTAGGLAVPFRLHLRAQAGGEEGEGCGGDAAAVLTSLSEGFSAVIGEPVALEARAFDGCGRPLAEGSVVAAFSNGDAPVALRPDGTGRWYGLWQPRRAGSGRVLVRLTAGPPGEAARQWDHPSSPFEVAGVLQAPRGGPLVEAQAIASLAAPFEAEAVLAPGAWITIPGTALARERATAGEPPLPEELAGTRVEVDGQSLRLQSVAPGLLVAQAPPGLRCGGTAQLTVWREGEASLPAMTPVGATAPRVFTVDGSGQGQALALDLASGQVADGGAPLARGGRFVVFATGLGAERDTDPPRPVAAVGVTFNGYPATEVRATLAARPLGPAEAALSMLAPGFVGVWRIEGVAPEHANLREGPARLVVKAGGAESPPVMVVLK